jgi:hypothetical protein
LPLYHISDTAPSFLVASCDPLKAERRAARCQSEARAPFPRETWRPRKHCWMVTMHDISTFLIGFIAGNAIVLFAMGLGRAAKD